MSLNGFASVILDVDSTLCRVEGIDWLARRRGAEVCDHVAKLTDRAMRGEIALENVYAERLALVHPTWDDIAALANAYAETLAPGAEDAVRRLVAAERRVVLVSGGIREAILPVALRLGIPRRDVYAVSTRFDELGEFIGFESDSPLATATGKRAVAESIGLPPRVLAMGDGVTDLAMRPAVDAFAAFTGFVHRDQVVELADVVLESFDQLVELVLA
ncbi:MAG: HAD-IB family phosphatase [Gemmatimonadota bacterium]